MYEIKIRVTRNKVHFYVYCENIYLVGNAYSLWIGSSVHNSFDLKNNALCIASDKSFGSYNLRKSDFTDMKDREVREVIINLEK